MSVHLRFTRRVRGYLGRRFKRHRANRGWQRRRQPVRTHPRRTNQIHIAAQSRVLTGGLMTSYYPDPCPQHVFATFSDVELTALAREGEADAFEELCRRFV